MINLENYLKTNKALKIPELNINELTPQLQKIPKEELNVRDSALYYGGYLKGCLVMIESLGLDYKITSDGFIKLSSTNVEEPH